MGGGSKNRSLEQTHTSCSTGWLAVIELCDNVKVKKLNLVFQANKLFLHSVIVTRLVKPPIFEC